MKEVKVLHSRNSLNYLGPWNLSVNSFQTKCSILTDNAFHNKTLNKLTEFISNKMFNTITNFFPSIIGYATKVNLISDPCITLFYNEQNK